MSNQEKQANKGITRRSSVCGDFIVVVFFFQYQSEIFILCIIFKKTMHSSLLRRVPTFTVRQIGWLNCHLQHLEVQLSPWLPGANWTYARKQCNFSCLDCWHFHDMSPESCGYFLAMSAVYSQRVIPMIICDSFWPHGICSKMLSIQCYFKFFRKCIIRRVHERFSDESRGRQFASVHELNNAVIRARRSSLMKSFLKEMWDCSSKRLNIGLFQIQNRC